MEEKYFRGHLLPQWANKTPYNQLARLVNDPVMRVSKGDHLYMTGRSHTLNCVVSLHYRKRSKPHDRPAEYILRWPFGSAAVKQMVKTFASVDQLDEFLRPESGDLAWTEHVSDQQRRVVVAALSHALRGERPDLSEEDMEVANSLYFHIAPDSETRSPARYDLPNDSRAIVWAALYRMLNKMDDRLEMFEPQMKLAESIMDTLGLSPDRAPGF